MKTWITPFVMLAMLLLTAPGARGQEQAEDDSDAVTRRVGTQVSRSLRKLKRDRADHGGWVWTGVGTLATGYDSNAFDGPSSTDGSVVSDMEFRGEVRREFGRNDLLKLSARAGFSPFSETSDLNEFVQKAGLLYAHRLSPRARFSLSAGVKHENDHALDINGNSFTRDFEYLSYRVKPTLRFRFGEAGKLRLSYPMKWKDYSETSALNSLDWWKHGPKVSYDVGLGKAVDLELDYSFSIQTYDEELAGLQDGTELATNPEEEHYFHRAGVQLAWQVTPDLTASIGYNLRIKDDRFQDFESYESHGGEIGLSYSVTPFLLLQTGASFSNRSYDNRAATDPGDTLDYDKITASFGARYEISPHFALFGTYRFANRNTNRDTGISYRDYTDHRVLSGVTLAY